jgi:hypothetical protein
MSDKLQMDDLPKVMFQMSWNSRHPQLLPARSNPHDPIRVNLRPNLKGGYTRQNAPP